MDGSPSHSASASTTLSIRKRKLISDDLASISLNSDTDSDSGEEMDLDQSSMADFTASRLQNANLNPENFAKTDGANSFGAGNAANSAQSADSDTIQTIGAYCAREETLRREEEAGRIKFSFCLNDGNFENMVLLVGLKNVIARQLPSMPKEYIVRLVMDLNHKSVILTRGNTVIGGITYRPFPNQKFVEIAFCAISGDEQVRGYGTRLMNHLKVYARDVDGVTHFLTYADNDAIGYFLKQGFTKKITLHRERWFGYIKEYDGVKLMEFKLDPEIQYTDLSAMLRGQRQAIDEKMRELSNRHIVYQWIDFQKNEAGVPQRSIRVEDIPGLREASWTPDQYGHSQYKLIASSSATDVTNQKKITEFMRSLLKIMHDHPDSWPFKKPVDPEDMPDYYDKIKDPIDLETMSKRVESGVYYVTLDMFIADVKRMFENARTYNSPRTIYYKCATRLKSHIMNAFQAGVHKTQ